MTEKICAVCGNSYKGIGNSCKDGSYCEACSKKLPKLLNLRVLDTYICADCGNRAAEMLHTGYDAIGYAFRRSHRCSRRLRYRAAKRMHPAGFMMQMRFALCIR